MPLSLANAGLAAQGANASLQDSMNLRTQQLGLDDLERTNKTNEDVRNVAAAGGTHADMALAAEKRGDYQRALGHRQAGKALEDESIKNVVHKAMLDPTPGNRPDLVEEAKRYGYKGMKSMALDDKGNLTFDGGEGRSGTMNVGVAAERMGLVKPYEHVLPPGSTYVRSNPVTGSATTFTAPPAQKFAATRNGTIYDQSTGEPKYTPPDESWTLGEVQNGDKKVPVSFNKKTGDAVILGPGGSPEHTQVHTDPTGKTTVVIQGKVFELTPGAPATPGKSHLFSADEPPSPGTPASLTPVNTDTPPVDGARKAPDGKWYVKSGNGYAEVITQAAPGGPPAAAPGAAPATAPAPAAAPKPSARKTTAAAPKPDDEKLPDVVDANAGPALSPGTRQVMTLAQRRMKDVEDAKTAKEMAPKKRAVETFRAIASSPRMTAEDAPLIKEAIATGLLTPAEKAKADKMLAKLQPKTAGYSDGGVIQKVSRGIEMVGRAAGTERGKAIEKADRAVAPAKTTSPLDRAKSIDDKVEAAEKGYARGGKVTRFGL